MLILSRHRTCPLERKISRGQRVVLMLEEVSEAPTARVRVSILGFRDLTRLALRSHSRILLTIFQVFIVNICSHSGSVDETHCVRMRGIDGEM